MQEDRVSEITGNKEVQGKNQLYSKKKKEIQKQLNKHTQNLSTNNFSHFNSPTKFKPLSSQSHQRLPGFHTASGARSPNLKPSKLTENKNKVRQLVIEMEDQGGPPDITMMMSQKGVYDIFDRKKINTTTTRMLKSRIRSVREAISQGQEQKNYFQESLLHPKIKDFLKGQKELSQIVQELSTTNSGFEELSTRVSLYRVELGECMDKILFTYNKL